MNALVRGLNRRLITRFSAVNGSATIVARAAVLIENIPSDGRQIPSRITQGRSFE